MRRCPTCHWINHDQDHYCRRCESFLRRHRPLSTQIEPHRTAIRRLWRLIKGFPWGGFIVFATITGVITWASYWGYKWTQPMLDVPPNPEFAPAVPIVNVTIDPGSPSPSPSETVSPEP